MGVPPDYPCYFRIFYEINHPAFLGIPHFRHPPMTAWHFHHRASQHQSISRCPSRHSSLAPAMTGAENCPRLMALKSRNMQIQPDFTWRLWLAGGWAIPLKNISQLGWLFLIYGKIKFMFQTTNQNEIVELIPKKNAAVNINQNWIYLMGVEMI